MTASSKPMLVIATLCLGCAQETSSHGHDHGAGGHAPHNDHDAHGHHGHEPESATVWGIQTQLFVEYPALVVGEDSPFAAHFTVLDGHAPIDSGSVVVELSSDEHPTERFQVDVPARDGLFKPVVTPAYEGIRNVTVRVESSMATETHELGLLVVHGSRDEAHSGGHPEAAGVQPVSFLLEQQWMVPFRVEGAFVRQIRPSVPAFATLEQPPGAAVVVAAPRDGRVAAAGKSFPTSGGVVGKGDPLFALTATTLDAGDPATLDLAVEQAQIRVDAARREVRRLEPLLARGVVARRRGDEAASALAVALAELKSAQRRKSGFTQSQRVRATGDAFRVPAPLSGTLAQVFVSPGTWVAKGDPLARIVDRDRLALSIGVPEAYVGRIEDISGAWFRTGSTGDLVDVSADALIAVGSELHAGHRTLPVRFRVDGSRTRLFAGQRVLANLIVEAPRQATVVPATAIVDDSGTDVVYVQVDGESFVRRPVRLGIRDGRHVEVLEGVEPGEWVVSKGAWSVRLASTSTEAIGHGHAH